MKDIRNRIRIKPPYAGIVMLKVDSESPVCLAPCEAVSSTRGLLTWTKNSRFHCSCIKKKKKKRTILSIDSSGVFFFFFLRELEQWQAEGRDGLQDNVLTETILRIQNIKQPDLEYTSIQSPILRCSLRGEISINLSKHY